MTPRKAAQNTGRRSAPVPNALAAAKENVHAAERGETRPVRGRTLAGIQYVGVAGISADCRDGVLRLLQYGDHITRARILSCDRTHCLLLTINVGDLVAVKSGFRSGYSGEGPRTLSYVLQVLHTYDVEIDECEVSAEMIERVDDCCLTMADVRSIEAARPVLPSRWYDYILDHDLDSSKPKALWRNFPLVIPFALIDDRIADLATSFWQDPDGKLLTGYRRLEDIVRGRAGINEHGARLLTQAFSPGSGRLTWKGIEERELSGRMNLFIGTFASYRNNRAHRESRHSTEGSLLEFLLLNHLYKLEKASTRVRRRRRRSAGQGRSLA